MALKHLAQNIPRYAGALARRVPIDPELLEELAANQPRARGGVNLAWLNGVSLEEKDLNPFGYVIRSGTTILLMLTNVVGCCGSSAVNVGAC